MWLCNHCVIDDITSYRKNLSFIRTTKLFDTLLLRRSSVLGMVDVLNFCKITLVSLSTCLELRTRWLTRSIVELVLTK